MRMSPVSTVEEYFAQIPNEDAHAALSRLREIIRDEIPDAKEVISYGMPMYQHFGMVVGYAAFKKHCSLFPGHTVADFADQLRDYKLSKGTIQFDPKKPLPESLVRAIVRARFEENEAVHREKKKK